MFKKVLMIGVLLSGTAVTPAFAQFLNPPATSFSASGSVQFTKDDPSISLTCNLTLTGTTGAAITGTTKTATATISGGTNTGDGCDDLTVDGGTVSYDSVAGDWMLTPTVVRNSGTPICGGVVHFTVNSGFIIFNSPIAPDCHATGVLTTTPTISEVP